MDRWPYSSDCPGASCNNNGWVGAQTFVPHEVGGMAGCDAIDVITGMYTTVVMCANGHIYGFGKNNNRFDLFAETPVESDWNSNYYACRPSTNCQNYNPTPTRLTKFENLNTVNAAMRTSGSNKKWWCNGVVC